MAHFEPFHCGILPADIADVSTSPSWLYSRGAMTAVVVPVATRTLPGPGA